MAPIHRLENALARAEELIVVGQQATALQVLHDAVMSKWLQHNQQALESIMLKFVELAVDLRRGRTLKDGLHQFRGACLNTNLLGLETVIKHLVSLAEAKLEAAQKAAAQVSISQIEDLEGSGSGPGRIELVAWCGGSPGSADKDKADRELVTPWLRFLWEVYRVVLDICRHNAKLEPLYREVAEQAFSFCRRFERKSEFRRLCEILRHHLSIIVRYPGQQGGIVLGEPESHRVQLELRFEQLRLAMDLELWQEAFRTIEDIHGLFAMIRKAADPSLVRVYYEALGKIFMMSDNYLFLAATWSKLFLISHSQSLSSEQISKAGSMYLLSTMAIPKMSPLNITSSMSKEDREAQDHRLATFLGLPRIPSAQALFDEIQTKDVLTVSGQPFGSLFNALLSGSVDAKFYSALVKEIKALESNSELAQFAAPIFKNLVALLFKGLSTSGSSPSIKLDSLKSILACDLKSYSQFDLDAFILQGCKTGDFAARIDHRAGTLVFERPCFEPQANDLCEEMLNSQMTLLVQNIKLASSLTGGSSKLDFSTLISKAHAALDQEHQSNLARKLAIERQKEQLEQVTRQKEQDEARERSKKLAAEKEAQRLRDLEEARERERVKLEQEREEIRREQAALRLAEIEEAKARLQKTKDAEKLVAAFKRLDYLERAFRQEEIPLLAQDYELQKVQDRQAYDERVKLIKEKSLAKHTADVEVKQHLHAMTGEYEAYLATVKAARLAELEARRPQLAADLEAAKEARRQQTLALLRQRYDQQLETEKLRAARAEAERQAIERARFEKESAIASQQSAASRTSVFGSSTPSTSATASATSGSDGKYKPPAFQSRAAAPATAQASTSASGGSSAFGGSSAWRRPGTTTESAPRDSKSAFGSSRRA